MTGIMTAPKQTPIDWEWIEPQWRAGVKSVLQIAAEHKELNGRSVSHTAINKHFRKLGIKRDLKKKVHDKADSIVSAAMVSGNVSVETSATDAEIINAEALSVATVQFGHRTDIPKKREFVNKLFAELEAQTDNLDVINEAIEALRKEDMTKLAGAVHKITSLPTRIKGFSDLVNAYKSLIGLERQAYNIQDGDEELDNQNIKKITRRIVG